MVVDSAEREPLIGATVIVRSAKDSAMTITDSKGAFLFSRLRDTLVTTEITYLGYKNFVQKIKVDLKKGTNLDTVILGTTSYTLDAAVIQGERPLMRMSGDTLVYNAESIPVLPGDETMELIMRLPGFNTEDGIKVSGKTVERTYVDGKPLFGEDAETALKYLEAREVVDIQVYEELIEEDKIKGFENGRKRTVMNLITRSKPNRSINLRASAGYGADIDPNAEGKHNSRYRANAGYHMFTEEKRFNINAGTNNSSRGGGGYNKSTNASIGFSRTWNKKLFFNSNYNFSDQYNRTQSISRQVYFPSEQYQTRTYDDTSRRTNESMNHNLSMSLENRGETSYLSFRPSASFSTRSSRSYRGALNTMDGEELNRVGTSQRSDNRSYNINENFHWSKSFNQGKHGFNFSVNGTLSRNKDEGWQIDSIASNSERTYLNNTGNSYNRSANANIGYYIRIKEKNNISVNYNIAYENSSTERIAIDQYTGQIDSSLTNNYTRNYTTQSANIGFGRFTEKLFLSATLQYYSSLLNKDELFPEEHHDRTVFRSFRPSVSFNYTINPENRISANYSTSAQQPGVEQLRNELEYSNPLYLSGGNPNLQQSYTHSFGVSYNHTKTENASSFGFNLNASFTRNAITTRQILFTEETVLPEYEGYVASKGATLTLPANVNGTKSAWFGFSYFHQIKALQSALNLNTSVNYNRTPSYIGETLNINDRIAPSLYVGLNSNKSTVYQFRIGSNTSYNHTANSSKTNNNTINQNINLFARVNFFKRLYTSANYNYSFYHNFSYADGDVNTHMLNVTIGYRFFEKRQLDINFTVHDLLNQTDNFSTRVMTDYISYSWTQRTGRYFMFNISYRLNKLNRKN